MKSHVNKPVAGGGTHAVGCDLFDDEAEGVAGLTDEHVSIYGHPLHLVKIAAAVVGATADRDYPHDGDGVFAAGTAAGVAVVHGIPSGQEVVGLLIVPWSGNATGRWRRIASFDALTGAIVPNRPWNSGAAPQQGDVVRFLVDCFRYQELHVAVAMHGTAAELASVNLMAALYDYPKRPDGSFRTPRRYTDVTVTSANQNHADDCFEPGFNNAQSRTVATKGALGAKWRRVSEPAKEVSLCSGAS